MSSGAVGKGKSTGGNNMLQQSAYGVLLTTRAVIVLWGVASGCRVWFVCWWCVPGVFSGLYTPLKVDSLQVSIEAMACRS